MMAILYNDVMLRNTMSLRKMIDFKPSSYDMAMLPLDVILYLKVSIVSFSKEDNYEFIRFLFNDHDIVDYLINAKKTIIYDFDGRETSKEKFVTIFELFASQNFVQTSDYLKEILEYYSHKADVLIDIYTHDDKEYRLSNLDGIVKLEEILVK